MSESRTRRRRPDPSDEPLTEFEVFAEEVCRRLERAAGASGPVLDRDKASALISGANVLCEYRKLSAATPSWKKALRLALRDSSKLWRRVDRAVAELADALLHALLHPWPPPETPVAHEERIREYTDSLKAFASMGDPQARVLLALLEAVIAWQECGPLASYYRMRIPRGRPMNPVARAAAEVLVPLWRHISDAAGVWKDPVSGEWTGHLFEVAKWFTAEMAARHDLPTPSAATLARALHQHLKNRHEKAR